MTFFDKNLYDLTEADLQWLVDEKYAEARIIEYKAQLNLGTNEHNEKFLAQISSFANSAGGNLIYGMEANKGVPSNLKGLEISDADGLIQSLDNIIRVGIRPRLSSQDFFAVPLANGNHALVGRIKQSWMRPHQLVYNSKHLFYTRSSNGLAQLDVEELRNLFIGGNELNERISSFRLSRISELLSGNSPIGVIKPPIAALHFIPISNFAKNEQINPSVFYFRKDKLIPYSRMGVYNSLYNFDGYLVSSGSDADFYTQAFRDLRIEVVFGDVKRINNREIAEFPQTQLANELFLSVKDIFELYKELNVEMPVLLMLSMIGLKNYKFMTSERTYSIEHKPIDRNILQFPPLLVEDYNFNVEELLKPTLNIFWQSAGFMRCFDYLDSGKWYDSRVL